MTQQDCPHNLKGRHYFTYPVIAGTKSDFEPTQVGESAADTLYRRVEYTVMACACGATIKQKVRMD